MKLLKMKMSAKTLISEIIMVKMMIGGINEQTPGHQLLYLNEIMQLF